MEADKSRDTQLGNGPMVASDLVPVQGLTGWRPKKSQYWVQRQERNPMSQPTQSGRGIFFLLTRRSIFYFSPGLLLIRWGPPMLEWTICFTQPTTLNVNLIHQHSHRITRVIFDQPVVQQSWHKKGTIPVSFPRSQSWSLVEPELKPWALFPSSSHSALMFPHLLLFTGGLPPEIIYDGFCANSHWS